MLAKRGAATLPTPGLALAVRALGRHVGRVSCGSLLFLGHV